MATLLLEPTATATLSDADLVAASRQGDRTAFGQIVRRYQGMVTGVIYSACGDLHRSEDLAQETFISAWKSLSGLREPAKLPAWLCQVARHRVLDSARSETRHDARLTRAFEQRESTDTSSPAEQVLSEEERQLLWATLREIPQPYRETMVLFYRQAKSVEDVADAMETTEANVRQRLARGRGMLREQVAAMLERNLGRSAPGTAFAVAVVAALPTLIPQTAAAAAMTAATAKGAAAAKGSAGLLPLIAFWVGPIVGLLGGAFGTWASIRSTEHPRERRFVVRMAVQVWVFVIASMALLFGLIAAQQRYHWSGRTGVVAQAGFWLVYGALLVTFVVVRSHQHARLRKEVGLPAVQCRTHVGRHWWVFPIAGVGSVCWMIGMASYAGDVTALAVIFAFAAAIVLGSRAFVHDRPVHVLKRFVVGYGLSIGLFTIAMANWRMYAWIAAMNGITPAQARERIPLWAMNVFVGVICAFVVVLMIVSMRRPPQEDNAGGSTEAH